MHWAKLSQCVMMMLCVCVEVQPGTVSVSTTMLRIRIQFLVILGALLMLCVNKQCHSRATRLPYQRDRMNESLWSRLLSERGRTGEWQSSHQHNSNETHNQEWQSSQNVRENWIHVFDNNNAAINENVMCENILYTKKQSATVGSVFIYLVIQISSAHQSEQPPQSRHC